MSKTFKQKTLLCFIESKFDELNAIVCPEISIEILSEQKQFRPSPFLHLLRYKRISLNLVELNCFAFGTMFECINKRRWKEGGRSSLTREVNSICERNMIRKSFLKRELSGGNMIPSRLTASKCFNLQCEDSLTFLEAVKISSSPSTFAHIRLTLRSSHNQLISKE